MTDEAKRLSEVTHRIGEALGRDLGGRFTVLANIGKEEASGSPTRTIKIVDRWGADAEDLSCTLELRKWDGRSNIEG